MTIKKKKPTALARRTSRPAAAKKTTRLVRRAAPLESMRVAPVEATPQHVALSVDTVQLGQLGLVELKLTDDEEHALAQPVVVDALRVKPNGAVYEPHTVLTRRLNAAFGRFGWALVPAGMPQRVQKEGGSKRVQVVCAYTLHIHGKPVAFAMGEQDYYEGNAEQTYGDALESTVASALRRCCKRIGIASELWDKEFTQEYLQQHAVKVPVKQKDGDIKYQWRRKKDPALPYEQPRTANGRSVEPARSGAPRSTHPHENDPITMPQRERLFALMKNGGRTKPELKAHLLKTYGFESSGDIKRRDYDDVCYWAEHPSTPPADTLDANTIDWGHYTETREPGSDDGD